MKLKIGGHKYKVIASTKKVFREHDGGALGDCFINKGLMTINRATTRTMRQKTFIHETLEGVNYHYSLRLDHDSQLTPLAEALNALIEDNPKLGKMLKEI